MYDVFTTNIRDFAGVHSHLGKTRCWGRGSLVAPPGIPELGPEVWRGDLSAAGVVMLGSPIGNDAFIEEFAAAFLERSAFRIDRLALVRDLQCRWVLLKYCCESRLNHVLRNVPPSLVTSLCERHDTQLWGAVCALLHLSPAQHAVSRQLATLPLRLGGLGLRSAVRVRWAAYFASWADSLEMIAARFPRLSSHIHASLHSSEYYAVPACLRELRDCGSVLDTVGFSRPSWAELRSGVRPAAFFRRLPGADPGEWEHGYQYYATQAVDDWAAHEFAAQLPASDTALLRSQSGPGAGDWLLAIPTGLDLSLDSPLFALALRRRLLLPLPCGPAACGSCGAMLDDRGHHALACVRSGWLRRRATGFELAWVQVLKEAGARVRHQPLLRSLAVPGIAPHDGRQLDVVASGLPLFGGRALVGDATLRSPLAGDGSVRDAADRVDGSTFPGARRDKFAKYPEFEAAADRLHFIVLAEEVGGRFAPEAVDLVRGLVVEAAARCPPLLQRTFRLIYHPLVRGGSATREPA
jgi:hypothetical protein